MKFLSITILLGAVWATSAPAIAGNTGTIRIYVRDDVTGMPMPGIDIFIYSSSYDTRPATSNAQGFAVFFNLEPGRYLVTARRQTPLTAGCMLVVNVGADEDYAAILSAHLIPPQVLYDSPYCRSRDPLHAGVTADVYDIF